VDAAQKLPQCHLIIACAFFQRQIRLLTSSAGFIGTVMFMPASILIASKSSFCRDYYAVQLRRSGYVVYSADGGVNCLEQTRQHCPDVVILEMSLPWGGSEGLLALRDEEPTLRRAAIIFIESGKSPADLYLLGRFSTHDFFLFQRFPSIGDVIHTIEFVLRKRQLSLNSPDTVAIGDLESAHGQLLSTTTEELPHTESHHRDALHEPETVTIDSKDSR
jgi:CheY-like chemotaxis protein